MYNIFETYKASGRPTGRTLFTGTFTACMDFVDANFLHSSEYVIKKGSLEDNTYIDSRKFLQWKS